MGLGFVSKTWTEARRSLTSSLRVAGRAIGFTGWTFGMVQGHQALIRAGLVEDSVQGRLPFIAIWFRGTHQILGVDIHVQGDLPQTPAGHLVVANHRSPLDVLVTVGLTGGAFLSHDGVAEMPVVGNAARAVETVFVDRESSASGAKAIRAMRRQLKAGKSVIVFPEGTTFEGDEVRPFKRGAFTAARGVKRPEGDAGEKAEVQVLPIGLAYLPGHEFTDDTFGKYAARMIGNRRTPIWIEIGQPCPVPRGEAQEQALRAEIQSLVDRAATARDAQRRPSAHQPLGG